MSSAHDLVAKALREGRLVRQPCEVCRDPRAVAHHDDYSKPLNVRWLCHSHHRQLHGQMLGGRALNQSVRVRVSPQQLEAVQALAERDERSVGAIVRRAVREMLEREQVKS